LILFKNQYWSKFNSEIQKRYQPQSFNRAHPFLLSLAVIFSLITWVSCPNVEVEKKARRKNTNWGFIIFCAEAFKKGQKYNSSLKKGKVSWRI